MIAQFVKQLAQAQIQHRLILQMKMDHQREQEYLVPLKMEQRL